MLRSRCFLLTLLVHLWVIPAIAQEDEIVRVDSSIVVLNAAVTDRAGAAVSGLRENQFHVLEDGIEQPISLFEAEDTPFAAVILLDTSGSMEPRISLARSAAIKFLEGLRGEDLAAIYTFDSRVNLLQDFSTSRDVSEKIFDIRANGMTALNDAIGAAARSLTARTERRKAIVVLSDGEDTFSKWSADKALKSALAGDITIYTIDMSGVETGSRQRIQNQGVLKNFAEKTGGSFIDVSGGPAMRDAFKNIVDELGNQYTIGYQPSNLKRDGKWRSLELRVSRPNLMIRTRKGYNAPKDKK